VQCSNCGMHYSTFKETGRLGCAECYSSFAIKLRPLLRRIHGSTRHVGKLPAREGDHVSPARQVQRLHDELQRAVEREEFERAAEIRDRIKKAETGRARPSARGGRPMMEATLDPRTAAPTRGSMPAARTRRSCSRPA